MKKIQVCLLTMSLIFSGCTMIYDPIKLPQYSNELRIFSSSENLSSMKEVPYGDYLVNESQVYIAGEELSDTSFALVALGLAQVESASKKIKGKDVALSVKFNDIVAGAVDKISREHNVGKTLSLVDSKDLADLVLIPSVRIVSESNENMARVDHRLTVKFIDPLTRKEATKNYWYLAEEVLPITGHNSWSSMEAKNLIHFSKFAFYSLMLTSLKDLQGIYEDPLTANPIKYVRYKLPNCCKAPIKAVLLEENEDYFVISNLFEGKSIKTNYVIVPRGLVLH